MRVDNHVQIRHIMLYPFEQGHTAAEAWRDLNELFGQGTIGERQVRRWFERFKSSNTSLEDEEGRGRLSNFEDQALLQAVEEDESLTTRMLAEQFNVDHSTIVRRLRDLGKVWKLAGWVPHELSDHNKTERVRLFNQLLQRNDQNPFLQFFVTGDESWLLFKNVKRKKVCVNRGQSPKGIPRNFHCKNAMWCVWWDRSGIIHWEIITQVRQQSFCYWWDDKDVKHEWPIPDRNGKKQHNINSDVYSAQLDRLEAAIKVKRPRKKNHNVFHHDNAKPHVAHQVTQSIDDKGWELLEHPPYSPTEAPTDYHVNRSLKNWQAGKVYDDLDDLVDDVKAWIASKDRHFFARGIDLLPSKWEAVIEVDGDYAPE